MWMDNLGVSFQPGVEENEGIEREPDLQQAIKLLNLRVPSVVGAFSPVSSHLLHATGGQGQPDAAFLRNIQQMLGLAPSPPWVPSQTAPTSSPAPRPPEQTPGGNIVPLPTPPRTPRRQFPGDGVESESGRGDRGPGGRGRIPPPRIIVPRSPFDDIDV